MALVFSDGIDGYNADPNIAFRYGWDAFGNYLGQEALNSGASRWGGNTIRLRGVNNYPGQWATPRFTVESDDIKFAFWVYSGSLFTFSDRHLFRLRTFDNSHGIAIALNSSGYLVVGNLKSSLTVTSGMRESNSNTLNPMPIFNNQWHHIEVRFKGSNTANGFVQAWVDGIMTHNYENVVTITATTDSVNVDSCRILSRANLGASIYQIGTDVRAFFDDIVIWDNVGEHMNTSTILGMHRIRSLYPVANGTYKQFTGVANTGGNWNATDSVDDDTSYAQSVNAGDKDSYLFTQITNNPTRIHGIKIKGHVKNPDLGSKQFSVFVKSGSVEVNSNSYIMVAPTSYGFLPNATNTIIYHTNPDTGLNWTQTTLNSAEIGIKVEN